MSASEIAAILVLLNTLFVTVGALLGKKKLDQIHVLVNSRLSDALTQIGELQTHLKAAETNLQIAEVSPPMDIPGAVIAPPGVEGSVVPPSPEVKK